MEAAMYCKILDEKVLLYILFYCVYLYLLDQLDTRNKIIFYLFLNHYY